MQAFWSPKGESWSQAFLAWPAEIGNESAIACVIMCSKLELCARPFHKQRGRNPFNQNFRAEVQKFLGGKWIATGPEGVVFLSENED